MQRNKLGHRKFALIFLLALAVRLIGIASRPIWYDEAFSILFSEKGPGAMLYGTLAPTSAGSSDIHPLGYYMLLWIWTNLFGSSLIAARALSILAGLGTVVALYSLGCALFDKNTALLASLFAALLPFPVHYSQEIRMYGFLALWLLLATYAYWRGCHTSGWRWWGLFAISSALAQYTHNLAAFYLVALALTPIIQRDWRTLRSTLLAGLAALALYLPWLIQLPAQFSKVSNAYWVTRPGPERLFTLLLTFTSHLPLPGLWLMLALFSATLVIAISIRQTVRAISLRLPESRRGLWLLCLAFSPPLLLFLFSQWRPVYIERALLPSGIIFCLWLAWSLTRTNLPRIIQFALFTMLAVNAGLGLWQFFSYSGFPYAPYASLDRALSEKMAPGDAIIHSSKLSLLPAIYFDRDLLQSYIIDPPGSSVDTLLPATQEVLELHAEPDIETATQDSDRVWFIIFQPSIDEFTERGQATHTHLEYLQENFETAFIEEWGDLRLYLFTK